SAAARLIAEKTARAEEGHALRERVVVAVELVEHSDLLAVVVDHEISAGAGHCIREIEAAERRPVRGDRDLVGASTAVRSAILVDGVNSVIEGEQIGVVVAAAEDRVIAGSPPHQVGAPVAVADVIAGTGEYQIVSAAAVEVVVAAGPGEDVTAARYV